MADALGCLFVCFRFIYYVYVSWACMSLCAPHVCRYQQKSEGVGSPGIGVTGVCEPLDVGAENWTQTLCEGSKCSLAVTAEQTCQPLWLILIVNLTHSSITWVDTMGYSSSTDMRVSHPDNEILSKSRLAWGGVYLWGIISIMFIGVGRHSLKVGGAISSVWSLNCRGVEK